MIFLIVFILSFLITYCIRYIALKKSLLAMPNERSSHTMPTPHGGGIAIAVTWFGGLIYLFTCKAIDPPLFYAMMCGSLLSIISYYDDLYELSPKLRILVQAVVSILGLYALGGVNKIDFGFWVLENPFITNTLAFFGIMWFINLYNFLDGIDGYAGSEAIFLALSGWVYFGGSHFLVLASSVAGFLLWNWHKAKIFMGDVGSTLLGYSIAIFALYYQNNGTSIFVWLILFGLFWFDATVTLWRRYRNGEKLSQAHRKHAYQRLVQSGYRHSEVVLYAVCINFVLFILGYSVFTNSSQFLLSSFAVTIIILYGVMKFVDKKKKFE